MNIRILLLLCCLATTHCLFAFENKIYPTPQSVKQTGKTVTLHSPVFLNGSSEADSTAVKQLCQLFNTGKQKKNYTIHIGERGDKAVKKYIRQIPEISGGYYLSIQPEQMIIAGHDEKGTFYAVQTLKQLLNDNTLPEIEIKDFPTIAYRGVVEGFYGQPWSHEDRIRQLQFYGENKLNTYIYGPKDDPYHSSPDWRKPYPQQEARQISELVKLSKANKVDFVWAIHPGKDIRWNEQDRQALLDKFEKMYKLGVRSFAVFFDDISGEGTDPNRQAELLNIIQERFIAPKGDVTPLIMCPTEYNKSWSNPKEGTYLDILGEKLHPSIMIMWTGDRVISDITCTGLKWINKRIKRPAYVWWNFPVNDYVRDHLLMGPAYGLDLQAGPLMSGFVSNPMERAEASKIAIFGVADYSWNPAKYNSESAWKAALHNVMPTATAALHTFASHNSDLGKNGHRYRRDESVEIKPEMEQFLSTFKQGQIAQNTLERIRSEYKKIAEAPAQIIASNDNPTLVHEIQPWLTQFEILGKAGQKALDLATLTSGGLTEAYWQKYLELLELDQQRKQVDKSYNQNPYQPGVKTGTLIMQPFVDSIRTISEQHLFKGKDLKPSATNAEVFTTIQQIQNLPIQNDKETLSISPALEVIRMAPKQYFGIALPYPLSRALLEINLNIPAALRWGAIEISTDGKIWEPLQAEEKERDITVQIPENHSFKYIRFINNSRQTREIYLKKFSLQSPQLLDGSNNMALTEDRKLSSAYRIDQSQSIEISNPSAHKQTDFILLSDLKAGATIKITGKTERKQETELGTIHSAFGVFTCPENITTLRLEITTSTPLHLYELINKK
ncbi:MAG: beta-N-acetylglucosaminidase domain-containing protein [Oscillibacter sp.]|nr:beta-N-acetylglucosaminidase domain-containing protein [Oscillibacter sp.]